MYDKVLGILEYINGWEKKEALSFWGKDISVKTIFETEGMKLPNEKQRKAYLFLQENFAKISEESFNLVHEFIMAIEDDILTFMNISKLSDNIFDILTIKDIEFLYNGAIAIRIMPKWDSHGLAILIKEGKITLGTEDLIWFER